MDVSRYAALSQERVARWLAWYFDICFIVAAQLDRWEIAASLLGLTDHFRDVNGAPRMQGLLPWFSSPIEELAKRARNNDRLTDLRAAGEALSVEEAQALTEQLR